MPIIFSDHAKETLKKRKISQKVVRTIIENPQKILSSFRGRKLRRGRKGSKMIEVVTRTEGSKITVITAYSLKEKI